MIEPQDSFFWQMALRSGLVDAARLRECWDAIEPDQRTSEAIDRRLAKRVVDAGYLTAWQARQVARGRGSSIQISKYVLLDTIGEGGMGRVFLARDTRLNRRVALKVLSRQRLTDAIAIARFRREARLGAQLQHENLVRIYDDGEVNGHCYLVMEYIEGPNVAQLLAGHGPMPLATACRLALQVALGLEHAREKGLIHRDVNPNNILVTRDGTAKLTDLGLAIEHGDVEGVTRDGGMIGNYDYISPEQARHSHGVDSRSDIYSLGCTLYHMVTGQVPFPYPSLPEKIQAQLTGDPPPMTSLVPDIPKRFEQVVAKMMRKAPEDRYPNPLAVVRALEPFVEVPGFAGRVGDSSSLFLQPAREHGRRATRGYPMVPSTADGEFDSSALDDREAEPSSSSFEFSRSSSDLLPTEPGGPTRSGVWGKLSWGWLGAHSTAWGARNPADLEGPAPFPESEFRDPGIVGGPPIDRRKWAARVSILAAMVVTAAVLAAKPWRQWTESDAGSSRERFGEFATVTVVKADGSTTSARDLGEALRQGGEGDLRILLETRGEEPVVLKAEGLEVRSGSVTIGAKPGCRPILIVKFAGLLPFLRVKTRANLKLEGVEIRAEFGDRIGKVPPLFDVKGTLELSRCSFWTSDQDVAGGVVASEGPRLSATGCWFSGFKQCLDVSAFGRTEVVLDQCMLVRSPGSDPWDSWAIRFCHEPQFANERKLTLRRCTISDACLLRADEFRPGSPLRVSITESAVEAGRLLAWKSGFDLSTESLEWSGEGNLYDLDQVSRAIRLGASTAQQGEWNDPRFWARLMKERRAQNRDVRFPDPSSDPEKLPRPEDFRVQRRDGELVGADPGQVGPPTEPTGAGQSD